MGYPVTRIVTYRRVQWAGHLAGMWETIYTEFWEENLFVGGQLED
jgi:hypothetical protein